MIAGLFTLLFSGALGRVHGGHPGTCEKSVPYMLLVEEEPGAVGPT